MNQREAKKARLGAKAAEKERKLAEIAAAREALSKEKARKARMIAKQGGEVKAALARLTDLPANIIEIDGQRYRIEADGALTELSTITPALSARPSTTAPKQTGYRGAYPDSREDENGNTKAPVPQTSFGGTAESAKAAITAAAQRATTERLSAAEILEGQPKRPGLEEFYLLREIATSLSGAQAFDLAVAFFSKINEQDKFRRFSNDQETFPCPDDPWLGS